jgi:radical SAM-linked protein
MSVASLRAYGLNEDLLDELALTRISGLTFAPEAGTQRMRDVVNKNVTEAHVEESARRVFSRGWHRLKLYFMIGLPTEEDDDVAGIVETGQRMLRIGRSLVGKRAEVTVSVSSHVPKPHTPFQWCAQNPLDEIRRKQGILRASVREPGLRLRYHDSGVSFVEGVFARGDRRLADVLETVWRDGARFDGWEEVFDIERWQRGFAAHGIDTAQYLDTRPITARLPWDHIDVGLEDGFLLGEYRRAVKGRASPPCGKVAGMLIHHTNLADAEPDKRKLVCYDCGVACDLSKMREDRLVALRVLDATERPAPRDVAVTADRETERAERVRLAGHVGAGAPYSTYRIRFAKVGRAAFLGHLDLVRLLARSLRRADLPLAMTRGFSPKPRLVFGPALGLGVPSLGELMDVDLEHAPVGVPTWEAGDDTPRAELAPDVVRERLASVCPPGIDIHDCRIVRLAGHPLAKQPDLGLGKLIQAIDLVIAPAADGIAHDAARLDRIAAAFLAKPSVPIARGDKTIDVRMLVSAVDVIAGDAAGKLAAALDWPAAPALLRIRVRATSEGSAKPPEIARALGVWGSDDPRSEHALVARLGVVDNSPQRVRVAARPGEAGACDGATDLALPGSAGTSQVLTEGLPASYGKA